VTFVIAYDVRGEGPLVVLLHSGGMSGRQWRRLAELLAATHRVVAPDFLGSGQNPPWPGDAPFHFDADVSEVAAVVDSLGGGPLHLVGHSYGGLIAATLARQRPQDVRSLALYDPVAFGVLQGPPPDAVGLADLDRAALDPVFLDDALGGGERWFQAFVDYWNGPGAWAAMPPAARDPFLKVGRKVYFEVRSLLKDRTPASAYAVIRAPTLLLTGEKTPPAGQRVGAVLASALPSARLETVAGAGHMGPLTHAANVNARIAGHIAAAPP
jgi:pimeloyl-ACP methyl ester carboxylesterase